ncbi:MAG: DNA/RNA non-specific endonuclease, partial [Pseudomonadota bacterium]
MDNTTIHPASVNQAHQIDLHLWRGAPVNLDPEREIQIIVNQGFVVGFSPARLQPVWVAYRVAGAERDVDFKRPMHYHDDLRLPEELQIGRGTFGRLGDIRLNVGHMAPNEVINRQFGRLAQMETFLMSNMSPQYEHLNQGSWAKLEKAIREIEEVEDRDHVWAIVGPIFGDQPTSINRGPSKFVPVPDAYFCLTVDPFSYPYDTLSKAQIDGFIIPQDAPRSADPQNYPATIEQIEAATKLEFFTQWGRDVPPIAAVQQMEAPPMSRLAKVLEDKTPEWQAQREAVAEARPRADSLEGLIEQLEAEAAMLGAMGHELTEREARRQDMVQHTLSWMLAARDIASITDKPEEPEKKKPVNIITYHIEEDVDGLLREAARTACNFWNRFLVPDMSIVIRLGIFTDARNIIAGAWTPYEKDGVRYGPVKFNTKYLSTFTSEQIAGTMVHELGHTLGFGMDDWQKLLVKEDRQFTGKFKNSAINKYPKLAVMEAELDGGPGTAHAHWDEDLFDRELMTGIKDDGEFVMPITIDVMAEFKHV